jgi:Fur family ferric uptake transcriptional regulator
MATKPNVEGLRAILRERGLRATPSRISVLQYLQGHSAAQPISHAEIVAALAAGPWDPATIYRNLMDLVEVGVLRRIDMGDHLWRFELVDGGHDVKAHPHFVCTECGTIECLPVMRFEAPKAKAPRSVKQKQIEVQLRGLCDSCT